MLLGALALGAAGVAPATAAATGTVEGQVTHKGAPVEKMRVCVGEKGKPEAAACALTGEHGESGKYKIANLAKGEYVVVFSGVVCPGEGARCTQSYVKQYSGGATSLSKAMAIKVEEGASTVVEAEMNIGGSISGTVTSAANGHGVPNLEVCTFRGGPPVLEEVTELEEKELVEFLESLSCAFTNTNGQYALEGLSGTTSYAVAVFTGEVCGTEENSPCHAAYVPQYYNNQQSPKAAARFQAKESEPVAGVDVVLSPLPPVSTEKPQLSGTPARGGVLQCSNGTWDPGIVGAGLGYEFAWLRNGVPIAGQTASSYTVQAADEGQAISCIVTASNGSASASATSNAKIISFSSTTSSTTTSTTSSAAAGTATAANKALVKGGKAALALTCAGSGPCHGTLSLSVSIVETRVVKRHGKRHTVKHSRKVVIGTASFSIAAGGGLALNVTLTSQGQHLVTSAGKAGVQAQVTGSDIRSANVRLQQVAIHKTRRSSKGKSRG